LAVLRPAERSAMSDGGRGRPVERDYQPSGGIGAFLPVTLCCGLVKYPWRRFAIATAIAAVVWACYAFLAGRLGGKAFEDKPVVGFAVAFGGVLLMSGIVELTRRTVAWRRRKAAGRSVEDDPPGA
jgi:hypothetical protein